MDTRPIFRIPAPLLAEYGAWVEAIVSKATAAVSLRLVAAALLRLD